MKGGGRVMEFEQIYNTYFNHVYLYIRKLLGNEHIAEEITSETFFKAMQSIDSFRGDCDLRVWLCQIAKNSYYSHLKKQKNISKIEGVELEDLVDPNSLIDKKIIKIVSVVLFVIYYLCMLKILSVTIQSNL